MIHLKKYWYWYLIVIIVVVAAILAYSNWDTVKGWFSSTPGASRVSDGATSNTRQICISMGAGQCSYLGLLVPCVECSKHGISIK